MRKLPVLVLGCLLFLGVQKVAAATPKSGSGILLSSNNAAQPTILVRSGSTTVRLALGSATRILDAGGRTIAANRLATQDTVKYTVNASGVVTLVQDLSFSNRTLFRGTIKTIDCGSKRVVFVGSTKSIAFDTNVVIQSGNQRIACADLKASDTIVYIKNTASKIVRIYVTDVTRAGKVVSVKQRASGITEIVIQPERSGKILIRFADSGRVLSDSLLDTSISSLTVGSTITATGRNTASALEARFIRAVTPLRITSGTVVGSLKMPRWAGGVAASSVHALSEVTGEIKVKGWGQGVALSSSTAYVASGPQGVQIVSIANPAKPVVVGSVTTGGFVSVVKVEGNYLYVADIYGITIFDITQPTTPTKLSFTSAPTYDRQDITDGLGKITQTIKNYYSRQTLIVANRHIFTTDSDNGFILAHIDATNPSLPVKHGFNVGGTVQVLGVVNARAATCMIGTIGSTYYAKSTYAVFDVTTSGAEQVVSVDPNSPLCTSDFTNFEQSGTTLHVYAWNKGLRSYDLTTITVPTLIASTPANAFAAYTADGQHLYAATSANFSARQPASVLRLTQKNTNYKVTGSITDPRFFIPTDALNEGGASLRALATNGTYIVALREADLPPSENGGVRTAASLFVLKF